MTPSAAPAGLELRRLNGKPVWCRRGGVPVRRRRVRGWGGAVSSAGWLIQAAGGAGGSGSLRTNRFGAGGGRGQGPVLPVCHERREEPEHDLAPLTPSSAGGAAARPGPPHQADRLPQFCPVSIWCGCGCRRRCWAPPKPRPWRPNPPWTAAAKTANKCGRVRRHDGPGHPRLLWTATKPFRRSFPFSALNGNPW